MLDDDALAAAAALPALTNAMPYLATEVERMKGAIIQRAAAFQAKGLLTPDLALQLWSEFLAAHSLFRRMAQRTRGNQFKAASAAGLLTDVQSEG